MKFLLIILLFCSSVLFSQENPWENKSSKNPWHTESTQKETKDTVVLVKNPENNNTTLLAENQDLLLEEAKITAQSKYSTTNDFVFGLTAGLLLNLFAATPDVIYVFINSSNEEKLIRDIQNDSTYKNVDQIELNKQNYHLKRKNFGQQLAELL